MALTPRDEKARRAAVSAEDDRRYAEAQRWRMSHPELSLHIYATPDGVRVECRLITPAGMARTKQESIAEVTFKPAEVTEIAVVDWGRRCLAAWLERQVQSPA